MGASSEVNPWEAEYFPEVLSQWWNLSCPWDVHLVQKVKEKVSYNGAYCGQLGWENLTSLCPQKAYPG